jgi:hypothetical protein
MDNQTSEQRREQKAREIAPRITPLSLDPLVLHVPSSELGKPGYRITREGGEYVCSCPSRKPCYHLRALEIRLEHMAQSADPHTIEGLRLILGGSDRAGLIETEVIFDAPLTHEEVDRLPVIKPTSGKPVETFRGVEL